MAAGAGGCRAGRTASRQVRQGWPRRHAGPEVAHRPGATWPSLSRRRNSTGALGRPVGVPGSVPCRSALSSKLRSSSRTPRTGPAPAPGPGRSPTSSCHGGCHGPRQQRPEPPLAAKAAQVHGFGLQVQRCMALRPGARFPAGSVTSSRISPRSRSKAHRARTLHLSGFGQQLGVEHGRGSAGCAARGSWPAASARLASSMLVQAGGHGMSHAAGQVAQLVVRGAPESGWSKRPWHQSARAPAPMSSSGRSSRRTVA
jgi:hypothetical protein